MLINHEPTILFFINVIITNLTILNVKSIFVIILLIRCYHVLNMNWNFICVKLEFDMC